MTRTVVEGSDPSQTQHVSTFRFEEGFKAANKHCKYFKKTVKDQYLRSFIFQLEKMQTKSNLDSSKTCADVRKHVLAVPTTRTPGLILYTKVVESCL